MNAIDVVIVAVLALAVLTGFRQGFILEVAFVAGAFVALAAARAGYPIVRPILESFAAKSAWLTAISYLIVFAVVWGAVLAAARVVRRGVRLLFLGWADRLAGAVLGLVQGAIVVELLLYLGQRVPSRDLHRVIKESQLAPTFLNLVPYLHRLFPHVAPY